MTGSVQIFHGLHPHLRPDAARIYWDAFGPKLGRVLGPEPLALAYIARAIRADHCLTALTAGGALVGLVGFQTATGCFAGGCRADLRAVYGRWGGAWRGMVLRLLGGSFDPDRLLIDGICVARDHRDQGHGTRLLHALYAEARARGYTSVRLEVVETNLRARALYAREGFVATGTETLGLLRHVFGFRTTISMVRVLPNAP